MSHIYLVRHGQKDSLIGDPSLTEEGRQQALKTAEFFAEVPIDLIVASPLKRTQETARYIADKKALSVEVNPLLRERINWGDDPRQSMTEFVADWIKSTQKRSWKPAYGDSSIIVGQRLETAIQHLEKGYQHVVLVTHGGVITDFLRNVFGDDHLNSLSPTFRFLRELSNKECSVTTLQIERDGLKLLQLASCNHL